MEETPENVRADILNFLTSRMIGPFSDEAEVIEDEAHEYYHYGFLVPPNTPYQSEEDDSDREEVSWDKGQSDSVIAMANTYRQSSIAISFQLPEDYTGEIILRAKWAEYYVDEIEKDSEVDDVRYGWRRRPVKFEKKISCSDLNVDIARDDKIRIVVWERSYNGVRFVTFSIINNKEKIFPGRLRNILDKTQVEKTKDNNIYQVFISAASPENKPIFVSRPLSSNSFDSYRWNDELLFRGNKEFGSGHGCSVEWANVVKDQTSEICSAWIPSVEVSKASTEIDGEDDELSISSYCDETLRSEACAKLKKIPDAYSKWIDKIAGQASEVSKRFGDNKKQMEEACDRNISDCREVCERIEEGIRLIEKDENVWASFCFANRAIYKSLTRKKIENPRWRAFQLCFILSSLPSTLDGSHEYRDVLDLIWFPTGGGKTEAYLGLSALLIAHTRLVHPGKSGTIILSRYTLRLLTAQQFERTAQMICACEYLRRREPERFGEEPITCGMFVGAKATPNTLHDANELIAGRSVASATTTTLPISQCPYCGADFDTAQQSVVDGEVITRCSSVECEFHKGIPILFVDEHIYAHPPTIVVGTVDKFALIAWDERIASILRGGDSLPPQLIIQDELHLISDSLGTLAALYETAMDYICSHEGSRPKVIGSTATIRRAKDQCNGIFARDFRQFPPPGLDIRDSFFNRPDDSVPGRMYVGISAQSRSPKSTLIWVMGILAQAAEGDRIKDEKIRDAFHTQVVYFNSLRELGGAYVAAEDDVPKFIATLGQDSPRNIAEIMELTSNVGDIREALEKLSTSIAGDDIDLTPLDLVLTTNMISVGIDVDRLGLMIVNGQPKSTSEYIQASSRVGRSSGSAGLIVTIYNPNRSRDKSHYERFRSYHENFYRHVEAVSVTPFSDRARDKSLHAVLFAICRQVIPRLAENESAGMIFNNKNIEDEITNIKESMLERVENIDPEELEETAKELNEIIKYWKKIAEAEQGKIVWKKTKKTEHERAMLKRPEQKKPMDGHWKTLQSMRDVQPPTPVFIKSYFDES